MSYLETMVVKQNVTRYADPWHHFQPFYYYLTTIPADFLPWVFFLPGALWLGWRRATANDRRGYLFAFCWMAVTVLFFSISPAKRTVYVLQMFPAMAMIVAWSFSEIAQSWSRLRRFALVPVGLLVGALRGDSGGLALHPAVRVPSAQRNSSSRSSRSGRVSSPSSRCWSGCFSPAPSPPGFSGVTATRAGWSARSPPAWVQRASWRRCWFCPGSTW